MLVIGQTAPHLSATLKTETHELISGVNAKLGGGDQGMNPHELLESALAACTLITLQMYIERKKWEIGQVTVVVSITSETKEATSLRREIKFASSVTDEQRQRLLEIANKCPIHELLTSKVSIETALTI